MTRHSPKPHAVSRRRFMGRMAVAAGLSAAGVPTLAGPGTPQAGRLRAGAAIADITPPIGVSMKGPIGGNGVVRSIHDPLSARAIVLDDGNTRMAICVCETTMIWSRSTERVKRLVGAKAGIPADRILISATHAHSTPRMNGMGTEPIDFQFSGSAGVEQDPRAFADDAQAGVSGSSLTRRGSRKNVIRPSKRSSCVNGTRPA